MSEEPARPEEGVGGGEAGTEEAGQPNDAADIAAEVIAGITAEPTQADPPVEPTQPTNVQELEMAEPPIEKLEATPEEIRLEAEKEGDVQDGIKKEPSALAAKPADAATAFPLADDNVMAELKAGEARAREAAKTIEALKEQLAESAKKDVMTEEDIRIMEQKQKELMDKMQEFEDITKKIQQLVGLVDVASSQLGLPQKTSVPEVRGRAVDPTMQPKGRPMDTLPKVIICGTSDIDEVPKIIVCEPTSARNGKHPLYQQLINDGTGKTTSDTKVSDNKGPSDQDQTGRGVPTPPNPWGYPSGLPGQVGLMEPVRSFGDGGYNMGMTQLGMGQAGIIQPGMGQAGIIQPGMGQAGIIQPGMVQAGMIQPGIGQYGMVQPGMGQTGMMPWTTQPGMMQYGAMQPSIAQYGMWQPGIMGQPSGQFWPGLCNPCEHPKKSHRTKDSKGENASKTADRNRSKNGGSEMKKSCRKKKQCYCQISGLCQLNSPPFPKTYN